MAKSLDVAQLDELKSMALEGKAPEDIANRFGIAVSTVHYHKGRYAKEGIQFPSVKGKRPTGEYTAPSAKNQHQGSAAPHTTRAIIGQVNSGLKPSHKGSEDDPDPSLPTYKFVVNGVSVQISGHARSVNILKDQIVVDF
jgi:hypothetical protein